MIALPLPLSFSPLCMRAHVRERGRFLSPCSLSHATKTSFFHFPSRVSSRTCLVFSSSSLPRSLSLSLLSHFLSSLPLPHFLHFSLSLSRSLSLSCDQSLSILRIALVTLLCLLPSSILHDGISLPLRVRISPPLSLFSSAHSCVMGISFSLYATRVLIIFYLPPCCLTSVSSCLFSLHPPTFSLLAYCCAILSQPLARRRAICAHILRDQEKEERRESRENEGDNFFSFCRFDRKRFDWSGLIVIINGEIPLDQWT